MTSYGLNRKGKCHDDARPKLGAVHRPGGIRLIALVVAPRIHRRIQRDPSLRRAAKDSPDCYMAAIILTQKPSMMVE